jgi:hypothetical protein
LSKRKSEANAPEEQSSQENPINIEKQENNINIGKNRNIAIKDQNKYSYTENYPPTNKFLLSQCEHIADKAIDLIFNNVSV